MKSMKKNTITLNETTLRGIISRSVRRAINEKYDKGVFSTDDPECADIIGSEEGTRKDSTSR